MSRRFAARLLAALAAATAVIAAPALAQTDAAMRAERAIFENVAASGVHGRLAELVERAGLSGELSGSGPFTLFAPVDSGFGSLSAGAVDNLMKPENNEQLVRVLRAHLLDGALSGGQILGRVQAGGGRYELTTLSGDKLVAVPDGEGLALLDENGNRSILTAVDLPQRNGLVHVVHRALMPR